MLTAQYRRWLKRQSRQGAWEETSQRRRMISQCREIVPIWRWKSERRWRKRRNRQPLEKWWVRKSNSYIVHHKIKLYKLQIELWSNVFAIIAIWKPFQRFMSCYNIEYFLNIQTLHYLNFPGLKSFKALDVQQVHPVEKDVFSRPESLREPLLCRKEM